MDQNEEPKVETPVAVPEETVAEPVPEVPVEEAAPDAQ